MYYIDTHCHIYAEEFDSDRNEVIQRAKLSGVEKLLLPNIDSSSIEALYTVCDAHAGICYPMMGLHPCSVKQDYLAEMKTIEEALGRRSFTGIGEIGLDYYWDKTFIAEQKEAFSRQLGWAKELQLPVAIHTRNSFGDAIEIVEALQDGTLNGVFHCFSGTAENAKRVQDVGFYMGIGGVVTFKNGGLDASLKDVPLDNLVLETDAPYLAPVPYRGKRNESSYIPLIAQKLADIKQLSLEEVAKVTTENAERLFGL